MLRDRLVCGVNDERIQRRLLAESQLEFKKAMEIATAMETADRNTRDLKNGNLSETHEQPQVHRVTKEPPKQPPKDPKQWKKECFRCGGRFHDADKCRYKDGECHKCRKTDHKASHCRNRRKSGLRKGGKSGNKHHLETTEESGEKECEEYAMFHMTSKES